MLRHSPYSNHLGRAPDLAAVGRILMSLVMIRCQSSCTKGYIMFSMHQGIFPQKAEITIVKKIPISLWLGIYL